MCFDEIVSVKEQHKKMFIFRITTDGYGMAHQMIRVRRDDNIEQLLDIYIDGPPPLSRNWLVIIPNSLILDRMY